MKKTKIHFILLFIFALIISCNQRTIEPGDPDNNIDSNRLVEAVGTESNFDIATWNIEHFPMSGSTTISFVSQLIRDMNIDMFGLQEMDETTSFYRLLDSLPDQ